MHDPETTNFYAFIVDGEIGHMHAVPLGMDRILGVMSSNPTVVEIPKHMVAQIMESFGTGEWWRYENGEFLPPAGE